jgi:hypothetical protein
MMSASPSIVYRVDPREYQKKRPQRGRRAEAACVGTPGWVGDLGGGRPAEVLALGYKNLNY